MTNHQGMQLRAMLTHTVRRSIRYRGMLVLVLWQVPVQPVVRPNGSIGILIGSGTDEHAEFSCSGDLLRAERVRHRVAAVEADYDLSPLVRVDAVAGIMRSDRDSHDGAFGTLQLRGDGRYFGAGLGLAVSPSFDEYAFTAPDGVEPDRQRTVLPSGYLRGGSATGVHVRADVYPPTPFAAQQIVRLGLGYNAIDRQRAAGFVGVASVGSDEAATGIAADLMVPITDRFGVRFNGYYAAGHAYPVAGFAAGGRFLLGGAPAADISLGGDR